MPGVASLYGMSGVAPGRRLTDHPDAVAGLGFAVASLVAWTLARMLHSSATGAWLFLPAVLYLTVRRGPLHGLLATLAANAIVYGLSVRPFGTSHTSDPRVLMTALVTTGAMLTAVAAIGQLSRARTRLEQVRQAERNCLTELGRRISVHLDVGYPPRLAGGVEQGAPEADLVTLALLEMLPEKLATLSTAAAGTAKARADYDAFLQALTNLEPQNDFTAALQGLADEAASLLGAEISLAAPSLDQHSGTPLVLRAGNLALAAFETLARPALEQAWQTQCVIRVGGPGPGTSDGTVPFVLSESAAVIAGPVVGPAGETVAAVVFGKSVTKGFSEHDERLLRALCTKTEAVVFKSQGTAPKSNDDAAGGLPLAVESLLSVSPQLAAAPDAAAVLRCLLEAAANALGLRHADITTNENDHALRRWVFLDGELSPAESQIALENSLSGWVMLHARSCLSEDLRDNAAEQGASEHGATPQVALGIPILGSAGRVLGSLNLYGPEGRAISTQEERLAECFAQQGGLALERTMLSRELTMRDERLQFQTVSDPITGLPNRTQFVEWLGDTLEPGRPGAHSVAMLLLDLDGFKAINDSVGRGGGDELLRAVGNRLLSHQRKTDLLARFDGDQFAVLLADAESAQTAAAVAERTIAELQRFFGLSQSGFFISASAGVAFHAGGTGSSTAEDLIREAGIALARAKATGKGRAVVFDSSMGAAASGRLALQSDLQQAVQRGELRLLYQPVIDLATQRLIGAEALVRWEHPSRGLLSPGAFIPLAEETGLIVPIGRWVLEQACRQAAGWQGVLSPEADFVMSVNLAVRQLDQPDLADQVSAVLLETGLEARRLELELTESAIMTQAESTVVTLAALKNRGVRLAIDDFGTGYSSLSYLQRLAVDTVKVDQSFTKALTPDSSTSTIVQAIVTLAHALDMSVTAEGIETDDQLALVTTLGCDKGQGYYFSQPCSVIELDALIGQAPTSTSKSALAGFVLPEA